MCGNWGLHESTRSEFGMHPQTFCLKVNMADAHPGDVPCCEPRSLLGKVSHVGSWNIHIYIYIYTYVIYINILQCWCFILNLQDKF